ncbi:MAG: efflux RND transporter periplasmic adaptor subunit [Gammaproteobacteria bacterium]
MQRSRWSRKNGLLFVAIVLAVTLFASLYAFSLRSSTTMQIQQASFSPATRSTFVDLVPVEGSLVPEKTVYIDSVEGGRIVNVHIETGEHVLAGMPLATLKNPEIELRVMVSEGQYAEQVSNLARAQLEFDQTGLQHAQQLADIALQIDLLQAEYSRYDNPEKSAIPRSVVERVELELEHQRRNYQLVSEAKAKDERGSRQNLKQLEDSVSRMKSGLDIQRQNLNALSIVSPISGLLTDFDINIGEVISPGERLGHVDQTGAFKIRASVDEFYLGRLFVGQTATASVANETRQLEIQKVYPTIENRQFQVDLAFSGVPPEGLRVGQNIRVRIKAGAEDNVLAIPNGAYLDESAGKWVFVRAADERTAERRPIETGRRNSDIVEIVSGLYEGDVVLTSGYKRLVRKTSVRFANN